MMILYQDEKLSKMIALTSGIGAAVLFLVPSLVFATITFNRLRVNKLALTYGFLNILYINLLLNIIETSTDL